MKLSWMLLRGAGLLAANTVVAAALGAAFWFVVARTQPPAEVGKSASVLNLTALISSASGLGLGAALIRHFPELADKRGHVASAAASAATLTALCLSFTMGVPLLAGWITLPEGSNPIVVAALLLVAGPSATLYAVQDGILQAQRALGLLTVRSVVTYGARIPLLVAAPASLGYVGITLAGVTPVVVAVVALSAVALPRTLTGYRPRLILDLTALRPILAYSLGTHGYNVLWGLPAQLIPTIALIILGPEESAYVAVAWMISGFLLIISTSVMVAVFIEASQDPADAAGNALRGLALSLVLTVPGAAVLVAFAPQLLLLFGEAYAIHAVEPLRAFAMASVPTTVLLTFCTLSRVRKRVGPMIAVALAVAGLGIVGTAGAMSQWGLSGAGWAWLFVTATVAAAVAATWVLDEARWRSSPASC